VPSRWEVRLAGSVNAAIPLSAPLAVVSGWLDDPQPGSRGRGCSDTPRSAHDDKSRKWTCGPLRTLTGPGSGTSGAVTSLQIRLLDDTLSDRLQAVTERGRAVRLGAHEYQIADKPRQVERASWQDLRRWSGARAWQVRFLTPACLRRHNRTSPWLAPESVARSLAERWHRLDPPTAPPLPGHGAGPVWVSDVDGHNEVQILTRRARRGNEFRTEEEVVSGFVGRMRYVCDRGTDAEAADFSALMAFALFAGVGSHTTYGFGVVVPERTWQPPTVQAGLP
jgi:CRISPR-associated endoribonuclease Cas6